ncbi:hypothetical protein HanRHA438_Chr09g0417341 [Helianthus annuus]|nr:hypothetical protein HanRHA438_Chr09g0417341 [Helianthus annuus]
MYICVCEGVCLLVGRLQRPVVAVWDAAGWGGRSGADPRLSQAEAHTRQPNKLKYWVWTRLKSSSQLVARLILEYNILILVCCIFYM